MRVAGTDGGSSPKEQADVAVVDDDRAILRALETLLRSAGFRVATFATAEEFLAAVPRARCLVLDLEMPGIGGLALLRQLGRDAPPTIVLTARGSENVRAEAIAAGARVFLAKPPAPSVLLDAIHDALEGA